MQLPLSLSPWLRDKTLFPFLLCLFFISLTCSGPLETAEIMRFSCRTSLLKSLITAAPFVGSVCWPTSNARTASVSPARPRARPPLLLPRPVSSSDHKGELGWPGFSPADVIGGNVREPHLILSRDLPARLIRCQLCVTLYVKYGHLYA